MNSILIAIALISHASTAPAPKVITLPVTVITAPAPHVKAGELVNCGDWKPLESGSGMVRTCEVSK